MSDHCHGVVTYFLAANVDVGVGALKTSNILSQLGASFFVALIW